MQLADYYLYTYLKRYRNITVHVSVPQQNPIWPLSHPKKTSHGTIYNSKSSVASGLCPSSISASLRPGFARICKLTARIAGTGFSGDELYALGQGHMLTGVGQREQPALGFVVNVEKTKQHAHMAAFVSFSTPTAQVHACLMKSSKGCPLSTLTALF